MSTNRQLIAVKKLAEIVRNTKSQKNVSMGRILREAGYSETVALHPDKVTDAKGFKELLEIYLPEEMVAKTHHELLLSAKLDSYIMDSKLTDDEITKIVESVPGCSTRKILRVKGRDTVSVYFWSPDGITRKGAVDMAYKIRGNYAAEKHEVTGSFDVVEITNYGTIKKK